jgi:DNA-binding MarR family transcriptional regulator
MSRKSALPGGHALDLERRLSYRFSIIASAAIRRVAVMYGPKHRLLPSAWKVMAVIGRYGPVSAKDVCTHTTVEPDKVSRAVDGLVRLGYVNRSQDEIDRRRIALSLTQIGRNVYEDIERATREVELSLLRALSASERKALDRILEKLQAHARQHIVIRNTRDRHGARPVVSLPAIGAPDKTLTREISASRDG